MEGENLSVSLEEERDRKGKLNGSWGASGFLVICRETDGEIENRGMREVKQIKGRKERKTCMSVMVITNSQ